MPFAIQTTFVSTIATAALLLTACTSDPTGGLLGSDERRVQPHDFVGTPQANDPAEQDTSNVVASQSASATAEPTIVARAANDPVDTPLPARIDPDDPLPVDGMIGQINGRPVYANDVLADLSDALAAKGRQLDAAQFENEAKQVINEAVRATLRSRLILAEAERALTEQEWQAVRYMRGQRREELLRTHGLGSLKATDRVLREETGRGLEETLTRFQEGIITRTYISQNLNALINVTRRDIERFYRENQDRFQPDPTRDLTIIVTDTQEAADEVTTQLESGVAFAEVATGPLQALSTDGVMTDLAGDEPFGRPEIEGPMVDAEEGEWFGPVEVEDGRLWFVKVDRVELAKHVSLEDAQASIEEALRQQQQSIRTEQFLKRLADEGNFTEPEAMVDALIRIAISRYAMR
ncbi:MAG: peptidylprolyl isomerase [Planctomycetota bacterium]